MSEYHKYIQELRAELKDTRRTLDRARAAIEDRDFIIARLQHDRDRDQEIIMDIAEVELDEAIEALHENG